MAVSFTLALQTCASGGAFSSFQLREIEWISWQWMAIANFTTEHVVSRLQSSSRPRTSTPALRHVATGHRPADPPAAMTKLVNPRGMLCRKTKPEWEGKSGSRICFFLNLFFCGRSALFFFFLPVSLQKCTQLKQLKTSETDIRYKKMHLHRFVLH